MLLGLCFKPCYKWNTFNTDDESTYETSKRVKVLNLVINGIPSIHTDKDGKWVYPVYVLNLVINGIPSIQELMAFIKPVADVLNLVINGIPSILINS